MKKIILKNLLLIFLLYIAALNYNAFLKYLNLVTGGTQGIALLLKEVVKISSSKIIFIVNIICLVLSFLFLNRENTYSSLVASFFYPFFVGITSNISFKLNIDYIFIWSIITGLISGITGGFIYKIGFSSGGISTINLLVNKYFKIKISISNFIINTLIIIFGSFVYGIKNTIYSIIVIFVSSFIIYLILKNKKMI